MPKYLLLALFCFAISTSTYANETITLQLKQKHAFQFAGFYTAIEQGYYQEEGLDVQLIELNENSTPVQHVVNQPAAYGVSCSGALLAQNQGKPIKVLGVVFQHSAQALIVLENSNIKTFADLKNKRVMLQPKYEDGDILAALKKAGIDDNHYTRQPLSYNIQDLITGKTDAMSAYITDLPYQLDMLGISYRILRPSDYGIEFYGDTLITSEEEVRNHPQRTQAFIRATARGWHYALEHLDETVDLILLKYNSKQYSREHLLFQARTSSDLIMNDLIQIGYTNNYRWQHIIKTYADLGLLPKDYTISNIVFHPPLDLWGFLKTYLWQIVIFGLVITLILSALMILLLRRTVASRTASLVESKTNLRKIIGAADIGILVLRDEKLVFANPYALKYMHAENLNDVSDVNIVESIHIDDRPTAQQSLTDVLKHGTSFTHVHSRYINRTGERFYIESSLMQIQYQRELAVLVITQDITQLKLAAKEKERTQKQTEHSQRLEALGVLAGGIAHDFNNILIAIMGNAAIAENKTSLAPSVVKKHLAKIVQSSEKAALLCKQMLAYSGRGKFTIRPLNISSILKEITTMLEVSIQHHASLALNLDEHLPCVDADESQIQQVIMNLVINAAEAIGKKGGLITITTGQIYADENCFEKTFINDNLPTGNYVFLDVTDTGCGMNKEVQKKLFEPFFTSKFTGRGLGMSAVLGIVRGHHGAIKISSTEGKGTSFRLLFPASQHAECEKTTIPVSQDEPWHPSGTVLIVDDEEVVRETSAMMLEDIGFQTLTAKDGLEGVETYRQHQHDISLVLLDMTMPKLNGTGCFHELRKINPNVKVILSSGYNEAETTGEFNTDAPAGFIQKPYMPESLFEVIKTVMTAKT